MDFSVIYLARRFCYRIFDFFHHWYVDGSRAIGKSFMGAIAGADRSLALRVTLHHFFEPLYKDYSAVGRILGVVFRVGRIVIGLVAYVALAVFFAAAYLAWLAVPPLILYYAAKTF